MAETEEFVGLACLCYDDPHFDHRSFQARSREMLVAQPELSGADIWAAAAAGDTSAVAGFLETDPASVNRPGPHGWTPLYCACYSRIPESAGRSTYEAAKLLLAHGADAKTFTLKNNDPPGSELARRFTALTGTFGGGSTGLANQPPHPRWRELAELLLTHGADPADRWALWINPAASLEILLRHGLASDVALTGRELCRAAREDRAELVRLLLSHGADTAAEFESKTPWRHAMEGGNLAIARMLEEAGASVEELSDVSLLQSLVLSGDETGARALLERVPDLLSRAPQYLVNKAAGTGRVEAARLAIGLGFDADCLDEVAPLHIAAGRGDVAMVRFLLSRGASPRIREPFYDATPVGWADFFDQTATRDLLLDEGAVCLFDALDYDRADLIPSILARDPAALQRPFAECLTRPARPEDGETPLARMVARGRDDLSALLRQRGAQL